nr:hypothetical protein [Nostoc sp. ChiSLP03a]MDZ8212495.1 hypothetical protein [Nostoc sp. ChiSLP03a]
MNFTWNTGSAPVASTVKEFVPNQRLAWDAKATSLNAYHIWLIIPTPKGCRIFSEETQRGILARLFKLFTPNLMRHSTQIWLEALAVRSSATTDSVR